MAAFGDLTNLFILFTGLARYPSVWNQYFAPLKSLNFGLGGDRTQHVLWRVENGEIPLNAQTIVIHVGTNNTDRDDPKVKYCSFLPKPGGMLMVTKQP